MLGALKYRGRRLLKRLERASSLRKSAAADPEAGREVTAAQIHGSGLGLSLVKRIIEAHGGRVTVESAEGRGSRFTLRLPAITEADQAREEQVELAT